MNTGQKSAQQQQEQTLIVTVSVLAVVVAALLIAITVLAVMFAQESQRQARRQRDLVYAREMIRSNPTLFGAQ